MGLWKDGGLEEKQTYVDRASVLFSKTLLTECHGGSALGVEESDMGVSEDGVNSKGCVELEVSARQSGQWLVIQNRKEEKKLTSLLQEG